MAEGGHGSGADGGGGVGAGGPSYGEGAQQFVGLFRLQAVAVSGGGAGPVQVGEGEVVDEGVVRLDAGALGVVRRGGVGAGEGVAAAGLAGVGCVEPGGGALVSRSRRARFRDVSGLLVKVWITPFGQFRSQHSIKKRPVVELERSKSVTSRH
ncbi:hypothetical protein [Streptomyces sp. SAI-129]|uniref:hypothetical protein n=1 Tax=Streptomyces sp. SAI-129 TaxID=3377727 RepID=UPI003C7A038F